MTTDNKELIAALIAFQGELVQPKKESNNPFYNSKYAQLPAIIEVAQPLLLKNKLCVVQQIEVDYPASANPHTQLKTTLYHESGDAISTTLILKPVKDDPQGWGSAITYARRYSYCCILGIAPEGEDDDGNDASGKRGMNEKKINLPSAKQETKPPTQTPEPISAPAESTLLPEPGIEYDVSTMLKFPKDTHVDKLRGFVIKVNERIGSDKKAKTLIDLGDPKGTVRLVFNNAPSPEQIAMEGGEAIAESIEIKDFKGKLYYYAKKITEIKAELSTDAENTNDLKF